MKHHFPLFAAAALLGAALAPASLCALETESSWVDPVAVNNIVYSAKRVEVGGSQRTRTPTYFSSKNDFEEEGGTCYKQCGCQGPSMQDEQHTDDIRSLAACMFFGNSWRSRRGKCVNYQGTNRAGFLTCPS